MSRIFAQPTDLVNISPAASIDNLSTHTVMMWIKNTGTPGQGFGVLLIEDPNGFNFEIQLGNSDGFNDPLSGIGINRLWGENSTTGETNPGNGTSASVNNTIVNGTWQHVASSLNNGGDRFVRLYLNALEVSYSYQQTSTGARSSDSVGGYYVGSDPFGHSFVGRIAELRIYNIVLTPSQIATVMNSSDVNAGGLGGHLVNYLTFLTDQGSTEPDASGNGNVGAITGATFSSDNPPAPTPYGSIPAWFIESQISFSSQRNR